MGGGGGVKVKCSQNRVLAKHLYGWGKEWATGLSVLACYEWLTPPLIRCLVTGKKAQMNLELYSFPFLGQLAPIKFNRLKIACRKCLRTQAHIRCTPAVSGLWMAACLLFGLL